jgi:hypothetical protein
MHIEVSNNYGITFHEVISYKIHDDSDEKKVNYYIEDKKLNTIDGIKAIFNIKEEENIILKNIKNKEQELKKIKRNKKRGIETPIRENNINE